jgi:hypothetical protein
MVCAARLIVAMLVSAGLAGCGSREHEQFLAERRAEAAGSRLEYFEKERLLFVSRPNGEKDGVDLSKLRTVFLHRFAASDSVDGKPKLFWNFGGPDRVVFAPYFSGNPKIVVDMLKQEIPGFDAVAAMKMVAVFESNRASLCVLWASEEYLKEARSAKEDTCPP